MWFMEEFAHLTPQNTFQPGLCWRSLNRACVPCKGGLVVRPWGSHAGRPLPANTKGQMLKPPTLGSIFQEYLLVFAMPFFEEVQAK